MTDNYYPPNLPNLSMSTSPRQQSPMFMDQIDPNSSIYPQSNFTNGSGNNTNNTNNNNNNNNNIIATTSRSLQYEPDTLRPSNLPSLRRSTSVTSETNTNNNNIISISSSFSASHILTPFDYPLSNPIINSNSTFSHNSHSYYSRNNNNNNTNNNNTNNNTNITHSAPLYSIKSTSNLKDNNNDNNNNNNHNNHNNNNSNTSNDNHFSLCSSLLTIPQQIMPSIPSYSSDSIGHNDEYNAPNSGHFNFLWWYPEIKFCELDPGVVPLS